MDMKDEKDSYWSDPYDYLKTVYFNGLGYHVDWN